MTSCREPGQNAVQDRNRHLAEVRCVMGVGPWDGDDDEEDDDDDDDGDDEEDDDDDGPEETDLPEGPWVKRDQIYVSLTRQMCS